MMHSISRFKFCCLAFSFVALTTNSHAGSRLTSQELGAITKQIRSCWVLPAGYKTKKDFRITAKITLNRDGRLKSRPVITEIKGFSGGGSFLVKSAARGAIEHCAPYKLPVEKYEQWKEISVTFRP